LPSASTASPFAGSAATASSLCERTMPGSVQDANSRYWLRSMASELDVHASRRTAGRRRRSGGRGTAARRRRAQRRGERLAALEALVGVLGERLVEERHQARRERGIDAPDVGGGVAGVL